MKLFRAHGLGNDYLVLEDGPSMDEALARRICDRHFGIGSDGVLEPRLPVGTDYGVRIWNPDGSVAEKSGNGLRIFAWWLHAVKEAAPRFTVWTGHGAVRCDVSGAEVAVAMGRARIDPALCETPLEVGGGSIPGVSVDMGNPHFVCFRTEPSLDAIPWQRWGAKLEAHPAFPNRTNVQFARVSPAGEIEARIFERGAGPTLASGSSACAVVAAAVHTGRLSVGKHRVKMQGGDLAVTVDAEMKVLLQGPVQPVARIEVHPDWLACL